MTWSLGERITITPQPQASVVIIDQSTGYIKAIVGGRGSKDASLTLNRATYTLRQPGSTFKIITAYAPAIDARGKTLATTYDNEEYAYEDGTPVSNWDLNNYTGPTTIRDAIARSVNVVAVKCITEITPRLGYEYAKAMGISTLYESYDTGTQILTDIIQPLALGGITQGVTNLELCGAYASIANLGQYIKPRFYTQVLSTVRKCCAGQLHPRLFYCHESQHGLPADRCHEGRRQRSAGNSLRPDQSGLYAGSGQDRNHLQLQGYLVRRFHAVLYLLCVGRL